MHRIFPNSNARSQLLTARARSFKRNPSEPERMLWAELRSAKLGVRFKRQVVIGSAIVDFLAPSLRLVVEVDGAHHALKRGHDARRDRELERRGYRVLRIDAQVILRDLPRALERVRGACERGG